MSTEEWITSRRMLPRDDFACYWTSIVAAEQVKDRLINQAILALTLRRQLPFTTTALHGLLLLYGPPGTGKTTLARGLGQELARALRQEVRFIEVNPHGLMSAEHGQSQQRVQELLCEQVPLLADDRKPTVVLIDEVESMAVARSAASLEANPADVHRATDAVLTSLDRNAREHPHLLTVATSNFTEALDEAFRSRADLAVEVPLPDAAGVLAILRRVLEDFGAAYAPMRKLAMDPGLPEVARALVGLDGRRVRKVITEALAGRRGTVVRPDGLAIEHLMDAARRLRAENGKGVLRAA